MLFAMRLAVVIIAWTALLLPWERCHAMCHDQVLPALAGHACHREACEDGHGKEPSDPGGHEAKHEAVGFVSLPPAAKVQLDAVVVVQGAAPAYTPVRVGSRLDPVFDHDPAPDLLRSTVLLL
jgi:hypothetical protein